MIDKTAANEAAVPATIFVSMTLDENPEIREEDYASAFMAVQTKGKNSFIIYSHYPVKRVIWIIG
jgi:hypothetical protein